MKVSKEDREKAVKYLRRLCRPGSTVFCILRHVSRSGMMRRIDLFVRTKGDLQCISHEASQVLDWRLGRDGIVVDGCGMDMGFHLVYSLSHMLYRDGFKCVGKRGGKWCPANDHSNGDRDYTPHMHGRSGGYALRHAWL